MHFFSFDHIFLFDQIPYAFTSSENNASLDGSNKCTCCVTEKNVYSDYGIFFMGYEVLIHCHTLGIKIVIDDRLE